MRATVERSGIRFLLHFTQVKNLPSILAHGIVPVSELRTKNMLYNWNDKYRLDGFLNASCFSIESPNYRMFYKYRNENPHLDWIVLGIKKDILWEKDCAFCTENAASNNITQTTLQSRKGIHAFTSLFAEIPNKPTRRSLNLPPTVPTNPQAEVLVFDRVEPEHIFTVAFENSYTMEKYKHLIHGNINVEVQKWLFEPRGDYESWR